MRAMLFCGAFSRLHSHSALCFKFGKRFQIPNLLAHALETYLADLVDNKLIKRQPNLWNRSFLFRLSPKDAGEIRLHLRFWAPSFLDSLSNLRLSSHRAKKKDSRLFDGYDFFATYLYYTYPTSLPVLIALLFYPIQSFLVQVSASQ